MKTQKSESAAALKHYNKHLKYVLTSTEVSYVLTEQ